MTKICKQQINPGDLILISGTDYRTVSDVGQRIQNWLSGHPTHSSVRVEFYNTYSSDSRNEVNISVLSTSSIDEVFEKEILK